MYIIYYVLTVKIFKLHARTPQTNVLDIRNGEVAYRQDILLMTRIFTIRMQASVFPEKISNLLVYSVT